MDLKLPAIEFHIVLFLPFIYFVKFTLKSFYFSFILDSFFSRPSPQAGRELQTVLNTREDEDEDLGIIYIY